MKRRVRRFGYPRSVTTPPGPAAVPSPAQSVSPGATPRPQRSRRGLVVEAAAAGLVVAAVLAALWRLASQGYLPQPFLYDLNYPLMGLYDTAYWANHAEAYGMGRSVYPPLSFVFLRLVSLPRCYGLTAYSGRDCDWLAVAVLSGFFVLNAGLVFASFRRMDRATALPRALALSLGLPMAYALECGNLVIVAFTGFVLAYGPLLRAGPLRWIAMALAMNFKPYLLVLIASDLVRRRWARCAGVLTAVISIYLITFALEGAGSPVDLAVNLILYGREISHRYWSDLYFATSYWPLVKLLAGHWSLLGLATKGEAEAWRWILVGLIRVAQLGTATCLLLTAIRPRAAQARRLAALILAMMLTTLATGQSGYVQIFLFFLILLEPRGGAAGSVVLAAVYLLSIPADVILRPMIGASAWSFLGGRQAVADFGLSVGQILRPAFLLVIQFGLIMLNARDLLAPRTGRRADDGRVLLHPSTAPAVVAP